jgi:hypothetical protein
MRNQRGENQRDAGGEREASANGQAVGAGR